MLKASIIDICSRIIKGNDFNVLKILVQKNYAWPGFELTNIYSKVVPPTACIKNNSLYFIILSVNKYTEANNVPDKKYYDTVVGILNGIRRSAKRSVSARARRLFIHHKIDGLSHKYCYYILYIYNHYTYIYNN